MVREAIATGSTIEEAKEAALKELNAVEQEEVKFEIIDIPQKKTFGLFGGSPARVRAYIEITPGIRAKAYLEKVISGMGLSGVETLLKEDEESIELTLTGEDLGALIGRRGETLDSLQYLVGLVTNRRQESDYRRIVIHVGDYREKREKALSGLALRVSKTALKYKRNQILEPMNPYERRIVHNAVQDIEGVDSWSIGDGVHRRVVIGSREKDSGWNKPRSSEHIGRTGGADNSRRPQQRSQGSGNFRRDRDFHKKDNRRGSFADDRAPKKDRADAPLYGRLDKE
ncbi:MAG TPA: single-stranded DNA-binding protein [Ruminococcaceae bacterium]|nr:single-stranded DNA-binding protein [Oscillospiraceae bacterium]